METELEQILDTALKEEMVTYLKEHPQDFPQAVDLAVSDRPHYAWRAAWLLWSCLEENDARVRPSIDRFIAAMPGKPDGHWRELMRIVSMMRLNDEQEGRLFDQAMQQWQNLDKKPSVRWMAFRFIADMVAKYPDLVAEVNPLLHRRFIEPLSPGIQRSVVRVAKEIRAVKPTW